MNLAQSIIAAMPTPAESIKPRWATVTSMDPLRVRFDGEENPLALTPINLANAKTEDRVWTMTFAGQVFIVGRHRAKAMGIMYKTDGFQDNGTNVLVKLDYANASLQGGIRAGQGGTGKGELIVPRTGWYRVTANFYMTGKNGTNSLSVVMWDNGAWKRIAANLAGKTTLDQTTNYTVPLYLTSGCVITLMMNGPTATWGTSEKLGTYIMVEEL